MSSDTTYAGFIAVLGRPNVGKSTLMNQLIERKLSITADKPQTTRHQITGIVTHENRQLIFIDTPGVHSQAPKALNRFMNQQAWSAIQDADLILLVLDRHRWTDEEDALVKNFKKAHKKVICVLNKTDLIKDKPSLLPHLSRLMTYYPFEAILPLSAQKASDVIKLRSLLLQQLPENPHFYLPEHYTNRPIQFEISEVIREKLTRFLGQELPYALTVEIVSLEDASHLLKVAANIWVERSSQKPIILGQKGEHLKNIASQARLDLEKRLQKKVFLQVWVKVRDNWSNQGSSLRDFGYEA